MKMSKLKVVFSGYGGFPNSTRSIEYPIKPSSEYLVAKMSPKKCYIEGEITQSDEVLWLHQVLGIVKVSDGFRHNPERKYKADKDDCIQG